MGNPNTDLTAVKTALCNSTAFRTWVNKSTAILAAANVKLYAATLDGAPLAVLSIGEGWRSELLSMKTFGVYPEVVIEFVKPVGAQTDEAAVGAIVDSVSGIMDDMEAQSKGGWAFNQWGPDGDPEITSEQTATDYVSWRIRINGSLR